MSALSPPLKWHGGKTYLADWIISHFPPHVHYVEPFAGGLAVLLRKPHENISEAVNDIDRNLINFWYVISHELHFHEFQRIIEATPFSQELFLDPTHWGGSSDPIDEAVRFFIQCRQSRQGLRKDFATMSRSRTRRGMNEQVSSWLTAIEGLPDIHDRLKRVVIFNADAVKLIQQEDSSDTLFYLDPPYLHETRVTRSDYRNEMSRKDHESLLYSLVDLKGKFILSGYRSELYDHYADGNAWRRKEKQIDCKASGSKKKPQRTECLWMNF